ncbi:MAG: hypothetical protein KC478_08985, partial [Bacteriovoracaceae bacterium]|nr:hypothetical protein [Bacteriovoracaceae bacterium]
LDAVWNCGRLELFDSWVQRIWNCIVEEKLFSRAEQVFSKVKERRPYELSNYYNELTRLMSIGEQELQATIASNVIDICTNRKLRYKGEYISTADCLAKLEQILLKNQIKSIQLEKQVLKLKRLKALKTSQKLSTRLLMEYLIIFKDDFASLSELLEGELLSDKKELRDCLFELSASGVKIKSLPPRLRSLFSSPQKVEESKASTPEAPEAIEHSYNVITPIESHKVAYIVSEDEQKFISRIKLEDESIFENPNEFVQSLCGIGFYKAAHELLMKMDVGRELFYLKCHVLSELGLYFELKDYSREILNSGKLLEDEKVPFSYLLGKSHLELGEKKQAVKALSVVIGSDPNFRDVQELMARAQA